MSQPTKRARPSASNNYGNPNKRPPTSSGPSSTSQLITGLVLLAAVLWSVYSLVKPFDARSEYLTVNPKAAVTPTAMKKALTDTGALPNPNAVKLVQTGIDYTITSNDPKAPLNKDTWTSLARLVPGKLAGATATYHADAPPAVKKGLDLQGGLRVVLEAVKANPTLEDMQQVRTVIENRVNQTGVAEPLVLLQGNNRILVELPGLSSADQDRALALLGKTAKLEFRIVKDAANGKKDSDMIAPTGSALESVDLGPVGLTGEALQTAQTTFDQFTGAPIVSFQMTPKGAEQLNVFTTANTKKRMAIVLDGKVQSAPNINEPLSQSAQISGSFTLEEANDLSLVLRSGSLRVDLKTIETRAIGPTLGQDAIRSGFTASLIGVGAVILLLFGYYGFWFGLVAALGLLFSGLAIFGMLSGLGGVLTLPGIAGLVLTIGAAVDGNVISFERIKEELRSGKGLKSAIHSGFEHSFQTIADVNISHLLSAIALFQYATGPVKGFAVTLAVGVIASTFSNLVFSRWSLELLSSHIKLKARDWFATPNIHFMDAARVITTASVLLAIIGGAIIFAKGFTFGVDFTSGTSFTVRTAETVTSEQVRTIVGTAGVNGVTASSASIVESSTVGIKGKDFTVRVRELDKSEKNKQPEKNKLRAVFEKLEGGKVSQTETVSPAVGNELRSLTIQGVLIALLLTLIYVAIRFDIIFGVGSVVAVAHDVAICLGLYALLGREFTITTVAAILTLIGYSLNDSIIVSDRIRENLKLMRGESYSNIVNTSINQTLSRTIMTSVATMLPLLSLLVFGGPVLRDFSLILLIGILVGTYSSIYIVAPMAVYYKDWQLSRSKAVKTAKA
jgi:SecD/SecF fusion protein